MKKKLAFLFAAVAAIAAVAAAVAWRAPGPGSRPELDRLVVGQWYHWDGLVAWEPGNWMEGVDPAGKGSILTVAGWRIEGAALPPGLQAGERVSVRGRFTGKTWRFGNLCGTQVGPEPPGRPYFEECVVER